MNEAFEAVSEGTYSRLPTADLPCRNSLLPMWQAERLPDNTLEEGAASRGLVPKLLSLPGRIVRTTHHERFRCFLWNAASLISIKQAAVDCL